MDNCGMQTNKEKKQESTGTDIDRREGVVAGGGGGEVSKHVEQLVKRRG